MTRTSIPRAERGTISATSHHKGLDLTRSAIALAVCGNWSAAERYSERRWGSKSKAARVTKDLSTMLTVKADLPAFNLQTDGGGEILGVDDGAAITARAEFFDVVVAASVLGKVPFRRVPFRVPFLTQDELTGVAWEGEGQAFINTPVKLTRHDPLEVYKLGAITVATMESLRTENINAELMIRDALVRSIAHRLDVDFLDPANTGTANEKPASITSGAGDSNSPQEPLFEWGDTFTGDPNNAWVLLNPWRAGRLHSANHVETGVRGGRFHGMPLVTSTAVPEEVMVIVDPNYVAVALGSAQVSTSTNATIEMEDAPSDASAPTVSGQNLVSMFQSNSAAVRAFVEANWKVIRPEAVQYFFAPSFGL
jgi:hypothetical protein